MSAKIRAVVVDDQDPEKREKILVRLEDGEMKDCELWAEPSLLYNPCGQGGYSSPPPGSAIWVEFENGSPEKVTWLGLRLG